MRLFVHGLGYTAERLARRLSGEGWAVAGTTRNPDRLSGFAARGWTGFGPEDATHLLISTPPETTGDPSLAACPPTARLPHIVWAGYLSTTGVYGDHGGEWVDETTALAPTGPRGRRRVRAEADWTARGLPLHVFRIAGIYGPGRNAIESVRRGTARRVEKPGQVFSRIHVDDLVDALAASIAKPDPGRIYNVCDDEPAAPGDVVAFACSLLGLPPPPPVPMEAAGLSEMARSFYRDNKRVSNARMKSELGIRLRHPSYREGLRALLDRPE